MASLTPGTLQKLLQNVGNIDFKFAGQHRSALLQVISIVPSFEDDSWKNRGYFLRVSDSMHSAYVSVPDEVVDLILSDKIQLGQFIYISRLDSGSPVPILRGVKPIPKRRPCVGDPKDLISSDFLNAKKVVKVKSNGKVKKVIGPKEGILTRRLSIGNGIENNVGVENRRLSLDSARKAWDKSPQSKHGGKVLKPGSKDCSQIPNSVVIGKVIPNNSPRSPRISPLKIKNVNLSPKLLPKPVMKSLKSSNDDMFPSHFKKVTLSPKDISDSKITWNSLPSTICKLGKDVRSYRNVAFVSATEALEEVTACENAIRCMSMFSELCEASQNDSSFPQLLEKYLDLHESMKKSAVMIHTLMKARTATSVFGKVNDYSSSSPSLKNTALWVEAAVKTDLSRFSLYTTAEGREEKRIANGEKHHYVLIESAPLVKKTTQGPKIKRMTPSKSSLLSGKSSNLGPYCPPKPKGKIAAGEEELLTKGSGLANVEILAEKLLSSSRVWFLDYLDNLLDNEFGFKNGSEDCSQIAAIFGQLKRVNQWLENAFEDTDARVEQLRKKLYRFLLDHAVDFSAAN